MRALALRISSTEAFPAVMKEFSGRSRHSSTAAFVSSWGGKSHWLIDSGNMYQLSFVSLKPVVGCDFSRAISHPEEESL
jgi:hypothetical protein